MLKVREKDESYMIWHVNLGTSFFWWDNRTDKGLAQQTLDLAKSSKP